MGTSAEDLYNLLRDIRADCTAIQSRITSAFAVLNELHIEDKPRIACPKCGAQFKGPRTLEEHIHVSHPDVDASYLTNRARFSTVLTTLKL